MKKYEIEYKDCTSMRCGVEIEALSEKEAIIILQKELIEDGDYMTQLIDIQEVNDDDGGWTLEDGTPLSDSDQETLNYAFENYVNEDGLTLEQAMERASQNK
jgi:hypothetical protein